MEEPSWARKPSGWRSVSSAKLLPRAAEGELSSDALLRQIAVLGEENCSQREEAREGKQPHFPCLL
jgi:hypothetical protein